MNTRPDFATSLAQLHHIGGAWAVSALDALAAPYGGLDANKAIARQHLAPKAISGDADALAMLAHIEGGLGQLNSAPWLQEATALRFNRVSADQLAALEQLLSAAMLPKLNSITFSATHCGDELAALLAKVALPALTHLAMISCDLSDKGLKALAKLPTPLQRLNLAENSITPAGLKAFGASKTQTGLKSLSLANNKLKRKGAGDALAAPGFASLEHLDVQRNDLSADFMHAVCTLKSLQSLDLAYNGFGGELMRLIDDPPPLRWLRLSGGVVPTKLLSRALRSKSKLWETLEVLNLANTDLSSAEVGALLGADAPVALRELWLPDGMSDDAIKKLEKGVARQNLTTLHMPAHTLSAKGLSKLLAQLTSLEHLDLSRALLSVEHMAAFQGETLRALALKRCGLTPAHCVALAAWPGLPLLSQLNLSENPIADEGLHALAPKLAPRALGPLRGMALSVAGLESLLTHGLLVDAEVLVLSENLLDDAAVTKLTARAWPKLHTLELEGNPLSSDAVAHIANTTNLPALTTLNIDVGTRVLATSTTCSPVLRLIHAP